ncbi:lysine--tRNA ligase [Candidatus Pacearchaeota archaeon]|nr:lysine--tRNA ligase [Candidatus Pacearchaeota archaeon]|tara:strand:+ start:1645 stop:3138 length:1494 start_codon:yes stop_codon:yes gene_type:complete
MAEKFFWADALADRIIKEKGDKKEYVCASGITPSGQVHIGNFREVITTDMVVRALRDKGKKVKFIYSWDDFDRFRKVPKGVDKGYEKYLGMPISDIPSPFNKGMSYAEFNEKEFENSLKNVHIEPEFIYQSEMNKKSSYADLIKLALGKKETIVSILNKYRKEPLPKDWLPIMIYCKKCKKDTTKITSHDGYNISYKCECDSEQTVDIRKEGIISIRWRVDWPLRWFYEKVDFEPGGIDHSVHGGSFTTAKEISKQVFGFEPPIYQFYEWISIKGGDAFSSSSGNATTLKEVGEIYTPEVLRFLFVGTKPRSAFEISFDNDVIKRYEDFDMLEKKYFNGDANPKEKRMYELSIIKIPKKKPEREGFRHLVSLVQIGKTDNLNQESKDRAEKAKSWIEKYAGDDIKFEVREKIEAGLTKKEKQVLLKLKEILEKKTYKNDQELFSSFYEILEKEKILNTEFFDIAYRAIIGKKKGPRLASLIINIGQKKVIKLLETIK